MNTLNELKLDSSDLKFRYSGTAEHFEWNDGTRAEHQTHDPDTGHPLWKVRVTIIDPIAEATSTATITVPSLTPPTAPFDSEICFDGLTVKFWLMNGTMGQSFKADAITTPDTTASTSTSSKSSKAKASA